MYSYGPPHMAVQKQDDQHEHTFSSYVRIRDVVLKTYLGRWTIGRSGERGSGISVLPARYDDDDDDDYQRHSSRRWLYQTSESVDLIGALFIPQVFCCLDTAVVSLTSLSPHLKRLTHSLIMLLSTVCFLPTFRTVDESQHVQFFFPHSETHWHSSYVRRPRNYGSLPTDLSRCGTKNKTEGVNFSSIIVEHGIQALLNRWQMP